MIEVQNLVKNYGNVRAVDGVSFTVQPGEVVGLLGPNGAGKSTTLRVLTGYIPADGGTVKLGGVDVREDSLAARRRLGYLPETNPVYESLGVWECLELFAGFHGVPKSGRRRRLVQAAERCSLMPVIAKDVGQLSKGYRQRLGLALAILHDPEVLILDEPTSALDPNQQQEVRDLILGLKQKKTVILSTHILPEAQKICDRLLVIHRGKIAAQGTVAELERRLSGGNIFYARLMGPREEIEPALARLPYVESVEYADETEPGSPAFHISSPADPRHALFALSSDRRWPIMELRRRSASLDEIFRSLTGGNP